MNFIKSFFSNLFGFIFREDNNEELNLERSESPILDESKYYNDFEAVDEGCEYDEFGDFRDLDDPEELDKIHENLLKKNPCPCEVSKKIKEIIDPVVFESRLDLNVIYEDGSDGIPLDIYKKSSGSYIENLQSRLPKEVSLENLIQSTYQTLFDEYNLDELRTRDRAYPRCNVGDLMRNILLEYSQEFRNLSEVQQINFAKVAGASYVNILHRLVSSDAIEQANKEYAQELIKVVDTIQQKKNKTVKKVIKKPVRFSPVRDIELQESLEAKDRSDSPPKTPCCSPAASLKKKIGKIRSVSV